MKYSTSTQAKNYTTSEVFFSFFKESPLSSITHVSTEDITSVSQDTDREHLETTHTPDLGESAARALRGKPQHLLGVLSTCLELGLSE